MIPLLELALKSAEAASEEIIEVYRSGFDVQQKADGSPVTEADLRANAAILSVLETYDCPVLSEETVVPFEQRAAWARFWLVDPLDGTKALIARNDEFTVNIALVEDGVPTLGVIAAPALGAVWFSARGKGAWEVNQGQKRQISALAPWPAIPRMVVTRFHDSPASGEFARLNGVGECLKTGSALKFVKVAASDVEFYPRFAGSSEWDTAAGDAIVREAGASLLSVEGRTPLYNQPRMRHPHFVAWRPPLCWEQIQLPKIKSK
jgi:3'(2'), 5'-bisphosphate nucleotidase